MPTTPVYGLRYQSLSDAPHGPNLGQNLALDVEDELVRIDGDTTSLDGRLDTVEAKLAVATLSDNELTSGTTTSTSYTATLTGGTACGIAFVAPPSGDVVVYNTLQSSIATAGFAFCCHQIRTGNVVGSGTIVFAATDDEAVTNDLVARRFGIARHHTGLTVGADYNVQQLFKSSSGNVATFVRKHLIVQPQLT